MTVPRTVGRKPRQRTRPALPIETFSWSRLPTWPIVAMHASATNRTSPEGSLSAGAPAELRTAPGLKLDIVDERAQRDVPHRQRVARQDVRLRARHDGVPDPDAQRGDDVALLAVSVVEQGQARRAIRIVLDR